MTENGRKPETSRELYERPTNKWICGWASEGRRCHLGPTPNGRCTVTTECTPRKQGDGWVCTRWADFGGPCEHGPLPDGTCCRSIPRCQPVRSIRSKRTLVTRWVMLLTLGVLLAGYGGFWWQPFVSTGGLSMQHSAAVGECSGCHVLSDDDAETLDTETLIAHSSMNDRCSSCHDMGSDSAGPHGLASSELEIFRNRSLTKAGESSTPVLLSVATRMPGTSANAGPLACATCHKEHRGRDADPRNFADLKCQSCHANQFANFGSGHPEFSQYPYYRRTRLIFDHARHDTTHYPETKKAFVCSDCHKVDDAGQQMAMQSFESACLDCHGREETRSAKKRYHHGQQIISKDIEFVSLPRLDLRTLNAKDIDVGRWPSDAKSRQLSPFMTFFLESDPAIAPILERLQANKIKLSNLRKADDQELQDVRYLAWAIKELVRAFSNDDAAPLGGRLELLAGDTLSQHQLTSLSGQANVNLFEEAIASWFLADDYDLRAFDNDLKNFRTELCQTSACPNETAKRTDAINIGLGGVATGVWARQSKRAAIHYQPAGHSDDFMKAWLDFTLQLQMQTEGENGKGIQKSAETLFASLGGADAKPGEAKGVGQCLKCHSVESGPDVYAQVINWRAFEPQQSTRGFSTFAHAPHLQLGDEKACAVCHELQAATSSDVARSKVLESFAVTEANLFTSNFQAMTKESCTGCHNAETAGETCTTCHNYHIGASIPTLLWTATSSKPVETSSVHEP